MVALELSGGEALLPAAKDDPMCYTEVQSKPPRYARCASGTSAVPGLACTEPPQPHRVPLLPFPPGDAVQVAWSVDLEVGILNASRVLMAMPRAGVSDEPSSPGFLKVRAAMSL